MGFVVWTFIRHSDLDIVGLGICITQVKKNLFKLLLFLVLFQYTEHN